MITVPSLVMTGSYRYLVRAEKLFLSMKENQLLAA
jgi:hypothetical protein